MATSGTLPGQVIPGQYIAVLKQDTADTPDPARALTAQHALQLDYVYTHALKGFAFRGSEHAAAALARRAQLAYVEPDPIATAFQQTVSGSKPLLYQWQRNGTILSDNARISGSQYASLTLFDLQAADAGSYHVIVTNSDGSVTSAVARLTVTGRPSVPPHLQDSRFTNGQFAFNLTGPPGQTALIQASTNLTEWLPIATIILGADPIPFTDPQSGPFPQRFYRLLQP